MTADIISLLFSMIWMLLVYPITGDVLALEYGLEKV